jgi:hypothetical protein
MMLFYLTSKLTASENLLSYVSIESNVLYNEVKTKKYHTVGTSPKSIRKNVERG